MSDHELLTKAMYLYKIQMDKHARANNGHDICSGKNRMTWASTVITTSAWAWQSSEYGPL